VGGDILQEDIEGHRHGGMVQEGHRKRVGAHILVCILHNQVLERVDILVVGNCTLMVRAHVLVGVVG